MKRPQNMTMRELIGLPVIVDGGQLLLDSCANRTRGYGGAFRDERGYVWGTLRTPDGWVRYPAHLSVCATSPDSPI